MLVVEEAIRRILADVPRQPAESVPLIEAYGRVLAQDVAAARPVPPFDNSAMDGFAVRAADCVGASEASPVRLTVLETVGAGDVATQALPAGACMAIMTGAPLPDGADSIVMVENTRRDGDGVLLHEAVPDGRHVRRAGEDLTAGQVVLTSGTVLTAGQVGVIASMGMAEVQVARRPTVALLTTGDELVEPGLPLGPGQIYGSNAYALAGLVLQAGGVPRVLRFAPDTLDGLTARLEHALSADVVVSTGGVSVGEFDFVKAAFARIGAELDFWKVRMKPGKPLAFGRVVHHGRVVPLFALPGNPVSCMVNFLQFTWPWLRTSMGASAPFVPMVDAVLGEGLTSSPGRLRLERVVLSQEGGRWVARRTGAQGSGMLSSMARGHGLMVLEEHVAELPEGAPVRVQLLDTAFLDGVAPAYRR